MFIYFQLKSIKAWGIHVNKVFWCSGYHCCKTYFNKIWTQVVHKFKSCSCRWFAMLRISRKDPSWKYCGTPLVRQPFRKNSLLSSSRFEGLGVFTWNPRSLFSGVMFLRNFSLNLRNLMQYIYLKMRSFFLLRRSCFIVWMVAKVHLKY